MSCVREEYSFAGLFFKEQQDAGGLCGPPGGHAAGGGAGSVHPQQAETLRCNSPGAPDFPHSAELAFHLRDASFGTVSEAGMGFVHQLRNKRHSNGYILRQGIIVERCPT